MKYTKSSGVSGEFIDKKDLANGTRVKILTECVPTEGEFQGKKRERNIVKVKVDGVPEAKNVDLNVQTRNGLIDAYGEDSKEWMNKVLTTYTEKTTIGGKRVIILYLLADGYEVGEDAGGYVVVQKKGTTIPRGEESQVNDDEELNPEDIPF